MLNLNQIVRRLPGYLMLAMVVVAPAVVVAACSGGETHMASGSTTGTGGKGGSGGGGSTGGMGSGGSSGGMGGGTVDAGACQGTSGFDMVAGNLPTITPTGIFVVNHWYLGDTNANDSLDKCAWMNIGLNQDGLNSTEISPDHCQPLGDTVDPGAVEHDGHNGIDNSFGQLLIPIWQQAIAETSSAVNSSVKAGWSTLMIRTNLADLPPGSPQSASVRLYVTAPLVSPPQFDGSDIFPIESDWLAAGSMNPDDALAEDLQAKLDGDRLTIELPKDASLQLKFKPDVYELSLTAHSVKLVLDMDPTHAYVVRGTIAGVFLAEEVIMEVKRMIGNANTGYCDWTQFKDETPHSLLDSIRGMQDIIADGTNHAGTPCSAISFGIGFLANSAKLGEVQVVSQPPTTPCGP